MYHFGTADGGGSFDICVTHTAPSAPANDACANAITLTSSTSCNTTVGSTLGGTQSIAGTCTGTADDDVWYQFTAQATTETITVQGSGGFDAVVDVLSGACFGTHISCTDATSANGTETAVVPGLTVGSSYLIRVYHFGTGDGGGAFTICVTHTAPASPPNDACANAITLTSSTTCNTTVGSTLNATQSIAGTCTGTADDDVWYQFTAQATTETITVQGSGGFDAVVDVLSGACFGTHISCTDATSANGTETAVVPGLTVGSTYLIRVYHFGTGDGGGAFTICVTHTAPSGPPNDLCANVISLTSSLTCNYTSGSTTGATQSIAGTCTGNGDDDVWYSFTAVATSHVVKVQGTTGFDPVIDIRSNSSCTGTNISCTDASGDGGLETANLTGLTIGTTYLIRVYNYGTGSGSGNFQICVTHTAPPSPPNDLCANVISLTSSLTCNYTAGSTTGATQSIPGTCTGTGDDDVWYSFVAVAASHIVKVQGAVGFDAVIDVRSNSSCTGTNISCTDASGDGGLETATLTGLTIGSTYLIRVYHFGAGSGSGNFQICVTHSVPSAPANDLCSNAIPLTSALTCSYTSGTTTGATQSIPGTCPGTGDDDVWYSFTAVATTHTVKVQSAAGFDAVIDVRSSSACSGTNINCSDGSGDAGLETANLTGLTVGSTYYIRVYNFGTGSGSGNFQICVTHVAAACVYSIAPASQSFTAAVGTGTIAVTTAGTCNWTAVSSSPWITITSGSSGTGNGTVSFSVSANTVTAQRTGTITVNGQTFTIAQSGVTTCTFTIAPTTQTFTSAAGTGTVTVTAAAGCTWTASANDSWITVTSGSSGSGNGTVSFSVTANSNTAQRVGTITIAGQVFTVTQSGIVPCAYTISPAALSFNSTGGPGVVTVTAGSGCAWTAVSNNPWITISSGASGTGNGTVNYTVAANTGSTQLTGTITIAGQTHTVTQSGIVCSYTISPTALSFTALAGNGVITVTAASGCAWTSATTDSWITITSGSTGSGNGTVNYSVSANSNTTQRLGSITVGGQTHTVVQNGTSSCTYTIAPVTQAFTSTAGTGSLNVTAISGCSWTSSSNNSWITITSGSTGSGNGVVNYSVTTNTNTASRTGTITAGGQIHTITQSGISCPAVPVIQNVGCALASNPITNVTYQWYVSGSPISGATTQFYTATQDGFYSVYVTDITNSCVSISQPVFVSCSFLGITEIDLAGAVSIYPNPSSGSFNIKSGKVFADGKVIINIFNIYGQEIYSNSVIPVNGEISLTIENITAAKGIYSIVLNSGKNRIIKRIVIN